MTHQVTCSHVLSRVSGRYIIDRGISVGPVDSKTVARDLNLRHKETWIRRTATWFKLCQLAKYSGILVKDI